MCYLLRLCLGDKGCTEFGLGEARGPRVGVGKNWVMGVSVVINRGAGI